jgi:DNA-binding CsgD family transcriptional regulator
MRAGSGSAILIGGEAGIGKTALADTICREAAEQNVLVLVGRCFDLAETPPYGPWVELFRRYRPVDGAPPLPAAFAEQRGTVGAVTSKAALFQQVLDFFTALASERSVILLLDDIHWMDTASGDLLRFLARSLAPHALLLLANYRSDELTRDHPLYTLLPVLVREAAATRLTLHALTRENTVALIRACFALPDADVIRLAAYLDERAEGNPFFISELLQTLEEEGALRQHGPWWALGDLSGVQMPLLLRQVIDARLARLGKQAQSLLAIAAIIGQDVALSLWSAIADTSEQDLMDVIERAMHAHLVDATEFGMRFTHALIREALYTSLLPVRRQIWHRRIAETLEMLPQPDPDAIAYHFQHAGDPRAVEWFIRAGNRADRESIYPIAIARYRAALALLDRAHVGDTPQRAWAHARLGSILTRPQPEKSIVHFDEAARIATQLGNRGLYAYASYNLGSAHCFAGDLMHGVAQMRRGIEAFDALSPDDQRDLVEMIDPNLDVYRGTFIRNLATAGQLREARSLGEGVTPHGLSTGGWYCGMLIVDTLLGNPERTAAAFRQACAIDRAFHDYFNVGTNCILYLETMLAYRADDLAGRQKVAELGEWAWRQGTIEPGFQVPQFAWLPLLFIEGRWDELAQLIPSLRVPSLIHRSVIARVLGALARERGDTGAAWKQVREMLPDGAGSVQGTAAFAGAQAMQRLAVALALDENDLPTAREWLEAHDRWLAWSGAVLGQSEGAARWATYFRQAGDGSRAHAYAERALAHATDPHQPLALLTAHRLLGELNIDAGHREETQQHLDTALALADACAAPYERALILLVFAELRAATGDTDAARTLLDEVRAICEPLGARPALARTDTLAARLTTTQITATAYPAGLSAREVDVLRLVAQGLTNPQVAERLFLSPRTVEQHLRSIYNKLGVSTRAAAAAFAVSHNVA